MGVALARAAPEGLTARRAFHPSGQWSVTERQRGSPSKKRLEAPCLPVADQLSRRSPPAPPVHNGVLGIKRRRESSGRPPSLYASRRRCRHRLRLPCPYGAGQRLPWTKCPYRRPRAWRRLAAYCLLFLARPSFLSGLRKGTPPSRPGAAVSRGPIVQDKAQGPAKLTAMAVR
jgi:hypothetical protein